MTKEQILKKYDVTERPKSRAPDAVPCSTCDAKVECDAMSDVGCNPYFRVCHDGWNLKRKETNDE